jgi:hypothetical protein
MEVSMGKYWCMITFGIGIVVGHSESHPAVMVISIVSTVAGAVGILSELVLNAAKEEV